MIAARTDAGKLAYNPALDGLRAIAVLAVIEYHSSWHMLGLRGYLGVDVFFVLSGFLITSILLREVDAGGIRLGAFYLRRARRLFPALCTLVLARMQRRSAIILLLVVYTASIAWCQLGLIEWRAPFRFDTRMSGLVFGSLLAFLPVRSNVPLVVLGIGFVALGLGFGADRIFVEGATGALILLSYQTKLPFLTREPLVYIGRISYGVYLYHIPVIWFVGSTLGIDGLSGLLLTLAIIIAAAALSFHTIESYFLPPRRRNQERPKKRMECCDVT